MQIMKNNLEYSQYVGYNLPKITYPTKCKT